MRAIRAFIPGLVLLAASAAGLSGAPISTLFNTGQGPQMSVDPNYRIIQNPAGVVDLDAYITNMGGFPSPHWPANGISSWISPQANYNPCCASTDQPGQYVYRTSFSLVGLNSGTASITLRAAADDNITNILINGISTGFTHNGFSAFSNAFTINSGFTSGINSLDFVTQNGSGTTGNPGGLRVEITSATAGAVPEPGTWTLLTVGAFCLVLGRRKAFSK